ncbi:hypothetical protein TVAG_437210 [Trichomonas vaginalis G3]|uniref:Uncharacterized protein n=1 Tax=Trichomonas vaginalis (strain ATCC PRA-98 / G3) TaxID=412133 RepID=A2DFG7_TRIV3|nr:hypothetical protein TVAG_437210 [Trichomonas vaginalis G3]|eukprot:XP_001581881.1 hypothetical protein [Trichomonas vaginalis G3]
MHQKATPEKKLLTELSTLQANRDFNRGLKQAEHLVQQFPNCAVGIAYKAYFTYMKDRTKKDECITMAKQANRTDMKSAEAWKICGMLYREMNDFLQYLQCYRLASRFDPTDLSILSDICSLHFFFGDYDSFFKAARELAQKTANTYNQMRYALGLWYIQEYEEIDNYLNIYERNFTISRNDEEMVFRSELSIFHAMAFIKLNKYTECLDYLAKNAIWIRDTVRMNELEALCYRKLGDTEKTFNKLYKLIKYYPENGDYFDIIEELVPKDKIIDELLKIKEMANSKYAWVRALELMDVNDSRYEPLLCQYLEPLLIKASPAAYISLKDLSDAGIDLAFKIATELSVPMNAVPMVKLFRAQVFYRKGDLKSALSEIDAGLDHTTTAIELLAWRSKFLKGSGRIKESLRFARKFANADPADRNANNLLVQNLLLNGLTTMAEEKAGQFAGTEDGKSLLWETQFNTYYLRAGIAFLRRGNMKKARDMYEGIYKHFDEYRKGEFNYIAWASKKPRALIELQDMLNNVEKEYQFYEAASFAMRIAILQGRQTEFLNNTLQAMKSLNPETLAIATHIFAENKLHLPAAKCWAKVKDTPYKFLALPAIQKLSKTEGNPLVIEVFNEFCKVDEQEPKTSLELFSSAEGKAIVGDVEGAKKDLFKAIQMKDMKYKLALKQYTIVKSFFRNENLIKEGLELFEKTYNEFEFDLMDEDKYKEEHSHEAKQAKKNAEQQQK